jgi:uroporphyrinogen decarboxylase
MMFRPELWREFLKRRWAAIYAAARTADPGVAIWYHSDGNIAQVLPDLIEIGVDILNPVQPECMDLAAVRRGFGDRLLFDGAIGTQSTMPWGTPDDVRRTVREMRELFGGTLCLSPTHVLQPEVPPGNVVAFFEACDAP